MGKELTRLQKVHMEAILGPDSGPFETFISDHSESSNGQDHLEAKSMFTMMKHSDPNSLAIKLSNFLAPNSHDLYYREKCAQLLHQLLTDDHDFRTWHHLSVSTQSRIKYILLHCIVLEESGGLIIQELTDTVWKLAASLLPYSNWPELLPFLYQCLKDSSSRNYLKTSAFLIFGKLADTIGETIVPKDLHPLFRNTLNDDTIDLDVRIAATTAVISFIQCVSSRNEKERFQDLLPGMMSTLTDALTNGDRARHVLILLIELAKNDPMFFRRQLVDVVNTVFEIAEAEIMEEGTRQLAVEFLITLVEAREKAPGMMKRLPLFINRCFAMLLKLLLDIKDDLAWHSAEDLDDETGTTSSYFVGMQCLERFSLALQGKYIAHVAKDQLSAYFAAPEWEKRHAALIAFAKVAEGCSKVMIKNLEQLVDMVLSCFQYPHPRVRCAACVAIIQMCFVFYPHFQETYHSQLFLALETTTNDFHPRVQAYAVKALCNFCKFDKPENLIPLRDGIVNKLLVLLQNNKQMVQQEAIKALSSLAEYVEEHFQTYYDTVMPHLKAVLRSADLKSNLILRASAMECISFVGMAVDREKFRDDAKQVMEVLMSFQGLQSMPNDSTTWCMLRACTRVCKCMGQGFLFYMSAVIPFLIQYAQLEPGMAIVTSIEEKAEACDLLCWYADILKEDFYPWIPQVVSVFVPLLKFHTNNDARKYAVKAMPVLLRSAKLAVEKGTAQSGSGSYFTKLSDYIILTLVEALHKEHVMKICIIMLNELNECLKICQELLNEGQLCRIVDEIKHVITESSNRKGKLTDRAKAEDRDAEEAEYLREETVQEDNILLLVGDILNTLMRTFKAAFLPFFDDLSSYLIPLSGADTTAQERITSISVFDILIEECPEAAVKYYDVFLPLLLDASNDENPTVRQNALYGLGLYALCGGSVFKPFVTEATSRIYVAIMHLRAREPENEIAYDAAVSTLAKICQFHCESIGSSKKEMSSGELLNIEPLGLNFPFELKTQISCSLHLSNNTGNHVAFRVRATHPKKYCVRPNAGILLPRSACEVIVTMQAQNEAPSDMQCNDKFLVESVVANSGTSPNDFTIEMFNKEAAGRVCEECKLRVIYLPSPQPPSLKEMSSGELLNIEPHPELKFPFELKKQIPCSLHLSNNTGNHVAFRVRATHPKKYCVRPNAGILLPRSACEVIVTMQAQNEAPSDMQCNDKFLVESVVANSGTSPNDFTIQMFNKEAAGCVVEECKLRVIYISPSQPPSLVAEGSPRQSMKDNGHLDASEVFPIWLTCLPIKGDLCEAKYVHGELCSMVERLDRELLGLDYQYLPKIISVFTEILCSEKDLASEGDMNRMISLLRHLYQTVSPATFESAYPYLLPRQEMELRYILST